MPNAKTIPMRFSCWCEQNIVRKVHIFVLGDEKFKAIIAVKSSQLSRTSVEPSAFSQVTPGVCPGTFSEHHWTFLSPTVYYKCALIYMSQNLSA